MKILLKSLIVWLLLLAIPVQGFASATMLLCAPIPSAPPTMMTVSPPAMPHDEHHMASTAQSEAHHHHTSSNRAQATQATQADPGDQSAAHHAGGKCNACATCCFGAAMAPPDASRVAAEIQHVTLIAFEAGHIGSVDLALPERPPQTLLV